jgi:hypothetical protein
MRYHWGLGVGHLYTHGHDPSEVGDLLHPQISQQNNNDCDLDHPMDPTHHPQTNGGGADEDPALDASRHESNHGNHLYDLQDGEKESDDVDATEYDSDLIEDPDWDLDSDSEWDSIDEESDCRDSDNSEELDVDIHEGTYD